MDSLVTCKRCGGNACQKTKHLVDGEEVNVQLCWGCGFTTNDKLKKGSKFLENSIEVSAD